MYDFLKQREYLITDSNVVVAPQGTILAKIEFDDQPVEISDPNQNNLMADVSTKVKTARHRVYRVYTHHKHFVYFLIVLITFCCATFSSGNKGFWKRQPNQSSGC